MKKILYSLSLLCLILTASCTQELQIDDSALESGTITLTLRTVESQTKATKPGEAAYNENLIKSVHYFFYPKDGTDSNTEKEPAKRGQVTNLDKQNQHTITVNASEDEIKNVLFKYPYNDCDVYVIVNLPSNINIDELPDRKLSTLKKIVLEDANFEANLIQPSFVMEGLNVATVVDRNKVLAAKGTIPVDRVAAKISVSIKVQDQIDLLDEVDFTSSMKWTSEPEQMKIELVNGVNRAVLSGNPSEVTLIDDDFFTDNTEARKFTSTTIDGAEFWNCEPFYTYPTKWEIGSDEEPYLFITLPWTTEIWTEVDGQKPPTYPCYYKIMLGSDELIRNTWYDLKINIGILGSFENTPEVILPIEDIDYFVADWSEGKDITSEILGGRYIVVDKETYTIYNENTLSIPFTSSHTCEIVDMSTTPVKNQATITYPDYSKETPNEDAPYAWNSNNWYIGVEGSEIVFRHAMRNDISAGKGNYDYAPYTIKFRIRHADQQGRDIYYKDITIIQYPALIVKADKNEGGNIVTDSQTSNDDKGYVFVNGNQLYRGDDWQVVRSCLDGGNNNPNMYIITATISTGDFVIADARQTSPTSAATLGLGNNTVSYYYQSLTDESSHNIIAPSFRMASSYGKCGGTITKAEAVRRCAAYQEDGFPAGRWRVPTLGEMKFIATLSYDSVIPQLFTSGSRYWTSAGAVTYNDNITLNNNTSAYVRCVYDEWYWKNSSQPTVNKAVFTWGDEQR